MSAAETCAELLRQLQAEADPDNVAGMARFGINTETALGVSMPFLRSLARGHRRQPELAELLWQTAVHEARILATLVDDPARVTEAQMERWVLDLNSWDLCDQCCMNLFALSPLAVQKAGAWSARPEEFVKRAGFVIMARLAVGRAATPDAVLLGFLPLVERESTDDRNFVRKAVNWALRQLGKRNRVLYREAAKLAARLSESADRTARWIGSDALAELHRSQVHERFERGERTTEDPSEEV